ncbi:transposase [Streptomyces flaveolus]|uniref:IS110 family transposase n=1 Tax=Streptomyces flaveolus TaxID=67297 RepID=UPI00341C4255
MTGTEAANTRDQVVVGGVDSHADTTHVAVVTDRGGHLADAQFPTNAAGYTAAIAFLQAHGTVAAVGVEGTSSYGSGFTHAARQADLAVIEVSRPDKAERRRIGASDPIDAYAAARAVVSATRDQRPERRSHRRDTRSADRRPLGDQGPHHDAQPDHAPPDHRPRRHPRQVHLTSASPPSRIRPASDPAHSPLLTALRTLAKRVQSLTEEHTT